MTFARRHATGLTLVTTAAVAVGLSVAPLPDALRPFPHLRQGSAEDLVAAIFPAGRAAPPSPSPEPAPPDPIPPEPTPEELAQEEKLAPVPLAPRDDLLLRLLGAADVGEAKALEAMARRLGARHVDIEQGCLRKAANGLCTTQALAPFFRELDALLEGKRRRNVRVIHYGDSLIASDHITDVIRARLQARYGSGGRGFLFVDRPTRGSGRTVRSGRATDGWIIDKLTDRGGPARPLGFTGVAFSTSGRPQEVAWDIGGTKVAELFFMTNPKGGDVQIRADGQTVGRFLTRYPKEEPGFAQARVPAGTKTVSLFARGPVQLYGLALEEGGPGIVYDSVGIPGATAKILLRADPELFREQLDHRDPSLFVLMLGGNEAFEMSRGETRAEEIAEPYRQLISRLRAAAPDSACLLTSPLDAGIRKLNGDVAPRPGTKEVAKVIREVALESGCAWWDMYQAMGGDGAVARWLAKGQMNEDLVHPRSRGMDVLGHLFDFALARAHLQWQGGAAIQDPPGLESPEALAPLFAKLLALEGQKETRVGLLQLGASHTSSHMFTDAVRARLGERFGEAGRGFIAAGRASKRLEVSGTERNLAGAWEVLDAMKPGGSRAFGLTGVRAEGPAGSSAEFSFCEECDAKVGARLQVHFLAAPGMGQMEVRLDGERMAAFPEPGEAVKAAGPHVIELRAPGARHVVTVTDLGPGPLALFGVAHELDRPGIVLDAVGLPGSTVFTLASYDQDFLAQELAARRPSTFFLFYGTNESAVRELDLREMRAKYATIFETLHKAAPGAACLLIGPTDRQGLGPKGEWLEAPSQRQVIPALREVARTHGCAFWSARAAMGGPGSIRRWLERDPPLANKDHIHLTPQGYDLLAGAFVEDLLAAYDAAAKKGGE